ncbi:MAG: DUF924 family protein [Pseudomonadales bacterium]
MARDHPTEIIILDQLSRNIFREPPRAFASDSLALGLLFKQLLAGKKGDP